MKKLILACCILLLTACNSKKSAVTNIVTKSQPQFVNEIIPINPKIKKGTLENGLTYYIRNNKKPENKVELRLVVNAGSILEDDNQLGLAHFMEHMNFNGTKNFKKNELVDYLQSIGVKFGAHLNAYTSFDETVYMLPIPSDDDEKLEKGFQILEDWAHNALLNPEDIDNERGVVLEEFRLGQGANERMMQKYLPKIMHGSKHAERLPIGTKENLENFDHQSLIDFYKDWYRPDLMAVIAVGDVDVEKLEQKIKAHFGKIPPADTNKKDRVEYNVPNHKETLVAIESDKEAAFSNIQVLYKDKNDTVEEGTVDEYRKSMLHSLFSQMINNRLNELRNSEDPPFVFASSGYGKTWARTKNGYQSFALSSPTGQLKALKVLLQENQRVRKFGFQKGEFDRAKKAILVRYERFFNDKDKMESSTLVNELIRNFLVNETIPGIEWEYNFHKNELPKVHLEEINTLITDFVHPENRVVIITGPEKEGSVKVKKDQVLELLNNTYDNLEPYQDSAVRNSLMTTPATPGAITNMEVNDKLGIKTITLSNGSKVTYKKTDFKNDEILFTAYSLGGTSLYSNEDLRKTSFINSSLIEAGINNFSKTDLQKILTGKSVSVRPSIGSFTEGFNGFASPKDLEVLFQMTHLYFTALNKDQKAYNSFVAKQKAFLGNLLSDPQFYFQKELGDFLNEGNERYLGFPSPESFDKSDYDLAYTKYKERFANAGDFNFYFVGNIDEKKLIEYSAKYLGGLTGNTSKENYKVHSFREKSGAHTKIVEKGEDDKSSVQIIFQGKAKYNKKEANAMKGLGEILTIKLIEKLREDESGVYGVGSNGTLRKIPYGWFKFTISFPCGPENVDKLKNASLTELQKIIDNGPEDGDLQKIKEAQILEHKENLKKNRYWINHLKNSDFRNEDANKVFSTIERINSLTKEDIQNVARKYLNGGYILAIHNPEKK